MASRADGADAAELEERQRDRMDAVAGSSAERTTAEEREGERENMQGGSAGSFDYFTHPQSKELDTFFCYHPNTVGQTEDVSLGWIQGQNNK
ncbi:hypothetical protein AOXY_G34835 [Acipenser oxyrinchus oxyrinchus]|uniref:Uncharacterized protein n=1 Tax=Acipenser oxyrinchus oxyrinchus TaxID=40147 RepID=A0AAD8CF68_ACIOX|nr:hypothetical protein AOXY_G34835 [Acipenser oxyrinchus oxyrinchus]